MENKNKESVKWYLIKFIIVLAIIMLFITHAHKCAQFGCTKRIPVWDKYCEEHPTSSYRRVRSTYSSPSKKSNSSSSSSSSHSSSSSSSSYDDAYDDYYYDGDYDTDRYESDQDYADGIDDAMDEYGDDW